MKPLNTLMCVSECGVPRPTIC